MPQLPKRPYLLRALYDWIVDSELTPYLLVTVDDASVQVPSEYVSEGKIVLNVSPMAVRDLDLGQDAVAFPDVSADDLFRYTCPWPASRQSTPRKRVRG